MLYRQIKQALFNVCGVRKRLTRDAVSEYLTYNGEVSLYCATTSNTTEREKNGTVGAQERLFKTVKDGDDLDVPWWKTCRNVKLL